MRDAIENIACSSISQDEKLSEKWSFSSYISPVLIISQDALPLGLLWFKPYFVVYMDFKIARVLALNSSPKVFSS